MFYALTCNPDSITNCIYINKGKSYCLNMILLLKLIHGIFLFVGKSFKYGLAWEYYLLFKTAWEVSDNPACSACPDPLNPPVSTKSLNNRRNGSRSLVPSIPAFSKQLQVLAKYSRTDRCTSTVSNLQLLTWNTQVRQEPVVDGMYWINHSVRYFLYCNVAMLLF